MTVKNIERMTALPTVEAVRANLLDGLAPVNVFAAAVKRTPRQIIAWIAQGLPIIRIGHTPYVRIDAARNWIEQTWPQQHSEPRTAA